MLCVLNILSYIVQFLIVRLIKFSREQLRQSGVLRASGARDDSGR